MCCVSVLSAEGLNRVRPAVYRAAMKLQSLQRLCELHVVSLTQLLPALPSPIGGWNQDVCLSREEVTRALNRMFHSVSQEVPGQVTLEAPQQTCNLIYKLYDRDNRGVVSGRSLKTALIALCADTLSAKHRALVSVAERSSKERGVVSRSSMRVLLQDLSQVPSAVQEECIFGCVDAAVTSCFRSVLTPSVCGDHVLSWLQSEPRLLLWLSTVYRLSVSQNVTHAVRCHACSTSPITGLRYRCMKCVNVHLCQSCFLADRQTKKHKNTHPVMEYCSQPSWRESLASLASNARYTLLPRRYRRREVVRRRGLTCEESAEFHISSTPVLDSPVLDSPDTHRPGHPDFRTPSHEAPPAPSLCSPPSTLQSKALQTEEDAPTLQQTRQRGLLKEVRDLQKDKWLLEQEFQAWRVTVQSEQGVLEDRCSEMEVTMEMLRQQNLQLHDMLTQTQMLSRTETQQHNNNIQPANNTQYTIHMNPAGEADRSHTPSGLDGAGEEQSKTREEETDIESEINSVEDRGEEQWTGEDRGEEQWTGEDRGKKQWIGEERGEEHISGLMEVQLSEDEEEEDYSTCSPVELEEKLQELLLMSVFSTIRGAPSEQHHQRSTIRGAASVEQHQRSSIRGAPSEQHHQRSTIRGAASVEHHLSSTIRGAPSEQHHQRSSISGAPSEEQHQSSTIRGAPSEQHHQRSSISGASSEEHHQSSTIRGAAPSEEQHQSSTIRGAASVEHHQRSTI
ncbi:dystrotelin [Lampris incognitus]|uniref:dystrotelin n=1 Tax=Lampris incognitus TaxID=2546036 RepID=UPI0024B4EB22|nr:dystrotelin [Lampris incognitus]